MKCPRCGFQSNDCSLNAACGLCGVSISGSNRSGSLLPIAPWETMGQAVDIQSFVKAFILTFYHSFSKPKDFFSSIGNNPSILPALIYGLVLGSLAAAGTAMVSALVPPQVSFASIFSGASDGTITDASTPTALIATPFICIASLLGSALYVHAMLFITRSRTKNFSATIKTICYCQGAAIFQIIPLVGPLCALAAWTYLVINGICAVHCISKLRAVMILSLPFFLLIAIVLAGLIIAGIGVAIFGGSQLDIFSLLKR